MIINSIADGQVTSNQLVEFNFRAISYSVSGSKSTLSGEVAAGHYQSIDATATGNGPYKVTLGYVNHSYQAQPVMVDSNDAMVTFWMAFPAGPNHPQTFVFANQK
ncbi:hypothetical protein [Lysobacter hankyongensis]|uniref:Uncharacterized protein n=1 Tax=Lysobacter hankyongensis TaxID=1176535 RepID=A0ABP9BY21_9GAMM